MLFRSGDRNNRLGDGNDQTMQAGEEEGALRYVWVVVMLCHVTKAPACEGSLLPFPVIYCGRSVYGQVQPSLMAMFPPPA